MAAIVFAVLAAPGIEAWVGPGYTTSAQVLVVLAIALALGSPFRALGNIMTGAGDLRALTFVRAGEVVINLALSVILVIEMGPLGAAFGTLGGVLLFRLPVGMILGCRAVGLPVRTLVRKAVVPHILPSIVSIGVLLALFTTAEASVVGLFVAAAAGCISYLAVYYVTGATPGDRERVLGYRHAARRTAWPAIEEPGPVGRLPAAMSAEDESSSIEALLRSVKRPIAGAIGRSLRRRRGRRHRGGGPPIVPGAGAPS